MTRLRPSLPLGIVVVLAVLASLLAPAVAVPAAAAGPEETRTTLRVTPESPVYGEDSITMKASVEAGARPVTEGLVDFYAIVGQRETYLGEGEFDDDGVAVRTVELTDIGWLQAGQTFQVTATYLPYDWEAYAGSTSERVVVSTRAGGSTAEYTGTTVLGPYKATAGVPTELTAEVYPLAAAGTVQFRVAGQPVGDPVPVEAGEASLPSYTFETAGWVKLSAFFTPSDPEAFRASDHAIEVEVAAAPVEPEETTTTVTGPATATVGVQTELTAEVSPVEAAGTVQFLLDGDPVGDPVAVDEGGASVPFTFTESGTVALAAEFTPADGEAYAASEDATEVVVAPAPAEPEETTTTVTGPSEATMGVETELTAEVSPVEAAGTVQFLVDEEPVGDPVEVVDGAASLPGYAFPVFGTRIVTAVFTPSDDEAYAASEGWLEVDVADPPFELLETTTTMTGPATATVGVETELTAEVSPADVEGSVQFRVDGDPVGDPVEAQAGVARASYTFDSAGVAEVTAEFLPAYTQTYRGSDDTLEVDVSPAPVELVATATKVTGPAMAAYGVPTELTAEVSPVEAAGTVQFFMFGKPVGEPVAVRAGRAALSYTFTKSLILDLAFVSAAFTPEDRETYAGSTAAEVMFNVRRWSEPSGPTPTTTNLTAPETAAVGQPVDLVATVSPTTEGTVQFLLDGQPVAAPVPVAFGRAVLTHTFTAAATTRLGARFTPSSSSYAGSEAPSRSIEVQRAETTVRVSAPSGAVTGRATTLTARVTPADVAGAVTFSVDGSPVGSPVAVAAGSASLDHVFPDAGAVTVTATFAPADTASYAASSDATGVQVTVTRPATTVVVSGPASVAVGEPAVLTAEVSPADAVGTLTFVVGGKSRTVPVTSGAAELSHTFVTSGRTTVLASFDPAKGSGYAPSVADALVLDVAEGAASAAGGAPIGTTEVTFDSGDVGACGPSGRSLAAAPEGIMHAFYEVSPTWKKMPAEVFFLGQAVNSGIAVFRYRTCFSGRAAAARQVVTAQCVPVDTGIRCPVDLPRFSSLSVTVSVPLPADAAGKKVRMRSSLTTVDVATGETVRLGSDTDTVRAPKRTSLTARLAPLRSGVASVRPGGTVAYRVVVANPGRYAADDVRTCVRVGRGARIRTASGAMLRGQRACWTVASLKPGATVVRRLTLVAPRSRGDLTLRAVVTPRPKQADVVLLRTALPVR